MTKEIKLTQGKVALVDDDMFDFLNQWKWWYHDGYAKRTEHVSEALGRKPVTIFMHRLIANTPDGMETDHKNGNKLDNRKRNLRHVTTSQNNANKTKHKDNTSGYKGVYWSKQHQKWFSKIVVERKQIFFGYFKNPIDAARAYDEGAKTYFGEYALLNFPEK